MIRQASTKRENKRKYAKRKLMVKRICILISITFLFAVIGRTIILTKENKNIENSNHSTKEIKEKVTNRHIDYKMERPQKRTRKEALKQISKWAKKDKQMEEIYHHRDTYPDDMLKALANNPELAEFMVGYYKDTVKVKHGKLSKKEIKSEFPLLLQWDKRWGYAPYGDSIIGIAGCGPTCLSMVIVAMTGDKSATPYQLAKYSENNGYYVEGIGTSWALMSDAVTDYGIRTHQISADEVIMKEELKKGHMLICSMREGDFTSEGHFIVIYGSKKGKFLINDPNSRSRSKKKWSYHILKNQIRAVWTYYA